METTHTMFFKLAKLMIAVSWADGELDNSEINALKEMLFSFPDLDAKEWAELELYMDSPVGDAERDILLEDVVASLGSASDKDRVLKTITELITADGTVSEEEQAVFNELKSAIESSRTGVLGLISRLTGGIVKKKSGKNNDRVFREQHLEDFIRNKVLYDVKRNFPEMAQISEDQLKKLTAAAALMGRVAAVDNEFSSKERATLISLLVSDWNMTEPEAELLAEIVEQRVMEGIDYHYVTLSFFNRTTPTERKDFIKCLFRIANASEKTSSEEIEEIRSIAQGLKISHADFIEAKLTISDNDRKGL
ncbi:MAG: TerB family tellurite resistance protein [Candidatus Latescibacteria bacterium]|nr:TerB family tellurite resistance protein [Candidatus Latescibacterota bacterium]